MRNTVRRAERKRRDRADTANRRAQLLFQGWRPKFEELEDRQLLHAGGGIAALLTLSYAPDGTDVSGHASSLHSTFSHLGSEQVGFTNIKAILGQFWNLCLMLVLRTARYYL